jgi:HEPN domain-containing protein
MMDIQKLIDYWKVAAESDLKACQHLYESKDYAQCLFWGHLVLEKLLKTIIVKKTQQQAPYSHDLVTLAKKARLDLSQEQRDQLNEINTFNQFGRYDNEVMDFIGKCTPEYVEKYFNITNHLATWLKEYSTKMS